MTSKRNQIIIASILPLILLLVLSNFVFSNNLQITNVTRGALPSGLITFNISWENSWYVTGKPANHDAVWIFIKFRTCTGPGSTAWSHALLSTTMTDHTLSSGLSFAEPISVNDRFGNPGNHNTGCLIRRATIGKGHIVNETVTLKIVGSNGPTTWNDNTPYDIKVFGIEMVQITEGNFVLGDYVVTNNMLRISSTNNGPVSVVEEFPAGGLSVYDPIIPGNITIPTNFPKGYAKFYCMKYEISMGQYAEFLNTVSPVVYTSRINISNHGNYRFNMYLSGGKVVTDRPDRACNYLSYEDLLTYLDWAALRPMTELEYEKICKGTDIIFPGGMYAWGTTTAIKADTIRLGPEDGTDTVKDVGANINAYYVYTNCGFWGNYFRIVGGDAGNYTTCQYGPIGCGIFARDATNKTREETGATFYGVMEMSGNVAEWCIGIADATVRSTYTGIWGDGVPSDATGRYDTPNWPNIDTVSPYGQAIKGGSWASDLPYCRVSDRTYASYYTSGRDAGFGGRGVR